MFFGWILGPEGLLGFVHTTLGLPRQCFLHSTDPGTRVPYHPLEDSSYAFSHSSSFSCLNFFAIDC
jgi:hypothetical protein